MYIQLNQTVEAVGGFETTEAIIKVTSFAMNANSPIPLEAASEATLNLSQQSNANISIYKSATDYADGEAPIQAKDIPSYQQLTLTSGMPVNVGEVYELVQANFPGSTLVG